MYYINGDLATKPKGYDPMGEAVLLWERNVASQFATRYNLTSFAITLNELTPGLKVHHGIFFRILHIVFSVMLCHAFWKYHTYRIILEC